MLAPSTSLSSEIHHIAILSERFPEKDFQFFSLYESRAYTQWEQYKAKLREEGWQDLPWGAGNMETCYFGMGWSIWLCRDKRVDYQI